MILNNHRWFARVNWQIASWFFFYLILVSSTSIAEQTQPSERDQFLGNNQWLPSQTDSFKGVPYQSSTSGAKNHTCDDFDTAGQQGIIHRALSYTRHEDNTDFTLRYLAPQTDTYLLEFEGYMPDGDFYGYINGPWQCTGGQFCEHGSCLFITSHDTPTSPVRVQLGQWHETMSIDGALFDEVNFTITTDPAIDPHPEYHASGLEIRENTPDGTLATQFFTSTISSVHAASGVLNFDYYHHPTRIQFQLLYEYPANSGNFEVVDSGTWRGSDDPVFIDNNSETFFVGDSIATPMQNLIDGCVRNGNVISPCFPTTLPGDQLGLVGTWKYQVYIDTNTDSVAEALVDEKTFTVVDDTAPSTSNVNIKVTAADFNEEMLTLTVTGTSDDDVALKELLITTGQGVITVYPLSTHLRQETWSQSDILIPFSVQTLTLRTRDHVDNESVAITASVPDLPKVTDLTIDSELNWQSGNLPSLTLAAIVTAEAEQNLTEIRWSTSAGEFGSVPIAPPVPQATVTIPNLSADLLVPLYITVEAVDSEGIVSKPYILSAHEYLSKRECPGEGKGKPVDTASGAEMLSATPIAVQGLLPIEFTLQYSSLTLHQTPFGRGWADALYSARLENRASGKIRVHWNDLKHNDFTPQGGGLYRSFADSCYYSELQLNQDGSYTLRRQNNTVYEFDSHGVLQKLGNHRGQFVELSYLNDALHRVTDPIGGVWLEYGYDPVTGRVASITDSQGRQAILHHEDDGDLDYFIDAAGFQTTYTYNEQGQALTGVNAEGDQLFRNTYDSNGRVETQDDGRLNNQLLRFAYDTSTVPGQLITTVTDRLGKTIIYTYDSLGRLLNRRDELGHNQQFTYYPDGKVATQTDENQHTTQYTYDAQGNLDIVTDPATFTTDYDYDSENNLVQLTNARGQLAGYATTWTYDPATNNLLSVNDNASHITSYTYTAAGQLETVTLPRTGVTVYSYDATSKGQPASMLNPEGVLETYSYDNAGNRTSVTVTGFSTQYSFDGMNRVSSLQPAGLPATTYQYNSRGLVTQMIDGRGTVTHYIYDRNGNRTEQRITVDGLLHVTRYDYDGKDRLIKVTDPNGNETRFEYDDNDRLLMSFNGENEARRFVYDPADNLLETYDALDRLIEARTYDNRDNLDRLTDALNRSTDHNYDELSRLVTQTRVSDPLNRETDFSYDRLDRLTSVIDANSQLSQQLFDGDGNRAWVAGPNNHQTDFDYDLADRQTVDDDPSAAPVELSYDARGLLETRTNGRNQVQTYGYDDAGRLTSLSDPVSNLSLTLDANGNIETLIDSASSLSPITRQFDELNRVTQYTDSQGQMIGYDYDLAGNLEVLTYPDGRTVNYGYDDANRLTHVTDWGNRTTTYVYDSVGRLDRINHHNGSRQEMDFDVAGQLTRLEERDGLGNTIREYNYSGYDHLARIFHKGVSETNHNSL